MYLSLAYILMELFSILGICLKVVDHLLTKIDLFVVCGLELMNQKSGTKTVDTKFGKSSWLSFCLSVIW